MYTVDTTKQTSNRTTTLSVTGCSHTETTITDSVIIDFFSWHHSPPDITSESSLSLHAAKLILYSPLLGVVRTEVKLNTLCGQV